MPSSQALSHHQIVPVHLPIDWSLGATTGDRVSLVNYRKVTVFVVSDAGTAAEDIIITAREHTAATSGSSADLVEIRKYWHKTGATAISAVGTWTEVTQTASADIDTDALGAENESLLAFEITADQLSAGFDFFSIDIDDPGTTAGAFGFAWYELSDPRYIAQPTDMLSAIA